MKTGKTGHATGADDAKRLDLEKKIRVNSDDIDSLVSLGIMMFEPYHQPDEAVRLLKEATYRNPQNSDAWFWLAKCYVHGFVDSLQAKEALERAIKIEPNRADCLSLMASVLMDLKVAPEECLRWINLAIEQSPDWITPRKERVAILLKMKLYDEAEAEIHRAIAVIKPYTAEPKDSIEEYYEEAVTGRSRPNIHRELTDLLHRVRNTKSKKSFLRKLFK
jgi:tetratricopeptide (TPR) repeat protein